MMPATFPNPRLYTQSARKHSRSVIGLTVATLLMIGLLLPGWLHISLAGANTVITVNSIKDDPTACAVSGTICLRNAIAAAASKSAPVTITFSISGSIRLAARLNIEASSTNPLTIDGTGQKLSLSGGHQFQIFDVYAKSVLTLRNLSLISGYAIRGGAIYNSGTLTIANSTLSNNIGGDSGGAIRNGGTLTIDNSTLTFNNSVLGGAIYSDSDTTLTITNSTLNNNIGTSGGAIHANAAQVAITGSTLNGNLAARGGAINSAGSGSLTIAGSTLAGNSGTTGGALNNAVGNVAVITTSTLSGNSATLGGAIVNNTGGALTLSNSTLSGNNAVSGGGLYQAGKSQPSTSNQFQSTPSQATVSNSTISGNTAFAQAGGLYADKLTQFNLLSTIVAGNRLTGPGAADADIDGAVTSLGANLIGDPGSATGLSKADYTNIANPGLSVLSDSGSALLVIPILANSPALGKGDCSGSSSASPSAPAVTIDQRGIFRKLTGCDIGAFELNKNASTPTPLPRPDLQPPPKNPTATPTAFVPTVEPNNS